MKDLDRWFNELTHKYLEVVRWVHLLCLEEEITSFKTYFRSIKKTGPLYEASLKHLSELIAFFENLISSHRFPSGTH
jgi:hypothetical protein